VFETRAWVTAVDQAEDFAEAVAAVQPQHIRLPKR
jgi:hypothetical protein